MEYIKLEDYGEILSIEEYLVDKRDRSIANFMYLSNSKTTKYTAGKFDVSADLIGDEEGRAYHTSIKARMKNQEKIASVDFKSINLLNIDKYINYLEKMIEKENKELSLPVKIYTYDNATVKTENTYSITVTYNNTDIDIEPIKIDEVVTVDGNQAVITKDGKPNCIYIFYNNGYRIIFINEEDNKIDLVTNIVFSGSNSYRIIELSNFEENSSILSNIPSLSILPSHLEDGDKIDLEYDGYGIVNKSSLGNLLYEECYFEDGTTDTIMSLHPLYMDLLDSSKKYDYRLYCLDQLDYNYDSKFARYTREICKIDEGKLNQLKSDIAEGENAGHPVLVMIDPNPNN